MSINLIAENDLSTSTLTSGQNFKFTRSSKVSRLKISSYDGLLESKSSNFFLNGSPKLPQLSFFGHECLNQLFLTFLCSRRGKITHALGPTLPSCHDNWNNLWGIRESYSSHPEPRQQMHWYDHNCQPRKSRNESIPIEYPQEILVVSSRWSRSTHSSFSDILQRTFEVSHKLLNLRIVCVVNLSMTHVKMHRSALYSLLYLY